MDEIDSYSAKILGKLILEELKGIRKDIKNEVEKVGFKLQEILISHLHTNSSNSDGQSVIENTNINSPAENKDFEENFPDIKNQVPVDYCSDFDNGNDDSSTSFEIANKKAELVCASNHSSDFEHELTLSNFSKNPKILEDEPEKNFSECEDSSLPDLSVSVKEELPNFLRQMSSEQYVTKANNQNSISKPSEQTSNDINSVSNLNHQIMQTFPHNFPSTSQLPQLFDSMIAGINFSAKNKSSNLKFMTDSVFRRQKLVKNTSTDNFYDETLCTPISIADGTKKVFCCNICGRSFAKRQYAKTHYKMHIGEKTFECTVCKVGFLTKSNLKRHMIVHTGKKPHKCNICHRSFSFPSNMKRHMQNVHSKSLHLSLTEQ